MLYLDLTFPIGSDFLSPRVTDQDSFLAFRCWFHAVEASANGFAYRRFHAEVPCELKTLNMISLYSRLCHSGSRSAQTLASAIASVAPARS